MLKKFRFRTEYNQFYIQDKEFNGEFDFDFWSDKNYDQRLAVSNGGLGVRTESYGIIKGELVILSKSVSNIDLDKYDHIVEASIEIYGDELQIIDCPTNNIEVKIKLKNSKYRVRVYSSNLESVLESDLSNDTDDDYYRIEIWPDDNKELRVLKQYKM